MPSSAVQSVLFFRVYREAALPLYAAIVAELCGTSHLPFQLATTLEDIGQEFIRLAEQVNGELIQRGILDREVDADLTVEAQIDAILDCIAKKDHAAQPMGREGITPALTNETIQQALKIAFIMTHDLPIAGDATRAVI